MAIDNLFAKSAGPLAVCGTLLVGFSAPAAAQQGIEGDYGTETPDGVSIENYGDNAGEITLPENAETPEFEAEGGDYGAETPEDASSVENFGDNQGEIVLPENADTPAGEESDMNDDYGAETPEDPTGIENFGDNERDVM